MEAKKKKIPQRRCVGCGETKDKKELVRVVRTPEGEVCLDLTGKKSGRGAYVCHSAACLRKARKSKRIEQNLEVGIPEDLYDKLEAQLEENA
jgi:predicted RNA-binding protein YlxR (DUF448 family)